MRVLAKVLVWLNQNGSGDRTEINLNGPIERDKWMRISAEDEGCKAEVCMSRTGGSCPFYQSKQAAQSAHIIIVNHALLLADVATGSRVLPEYDYLIVDEAHHLEPATTNALSYRATQGDLARLLREMGGTSSGVLGRLLNAAKDLLRPSDFAAYHQAIQRATDLVFRLEHDFVQFFRSVDSFLEERRDGRPVSSYGQQERIIPATRTLPIWTDVEITWDSASETSGLLLNLVADLHKSIGNDGDNLPEELQDLQGSLADIHRRLSEARTNMQGLVNDAQMNLIYWAEIKSQNTQIALQAAPLHIGPLMEKFLWNEKACLILTSATLTAHGEFDYIRSRLNAETADELALGSPFDYETSALLYLVNDIPEPSDANNFQRSVEQSIIRIAKATHGRMLVLFTSYAQLKRTSNSIAGPLGADDIQVYEQGEGASANTLLENFREIGPGRAARYARLLGRGRYPRRGTLGIGDRQTAV